MEEYNRRALIYEDYSN